MLVGSSSDSLHTVTSVLIDKQQKAPVARQCLLSPSVKEEIKQDESENMSEPNGLKQVLVQALHPSGDGENRN